LYHKKILGVSINRFSTSESRKNKVKTNPNIRFAIQDERIFWNSNGLRDQAKPRFLFDSVKGYQLDFIALLEAKTSDFNTNALSHFCANKNFIWDWTPPKGRSGGIPVGFKKDKIKVPDINHGNFSLKFKLRNKEDSFEWCLLAMYGAAQENEKEYFLSELV
jgi:hypothetical protein